MNSHETALEAAKAAYWHEVHNGEGYSDKCYEAAISAYLSTLSPDVSGLVERLRKGPAVYEFPTETIHSEPDKLHREAADALIALSLQLAAVEKAVVAAWNSLGADDVAETIEDADFLSRAADGDLAEQISVLVKQRDAAEASLTLAQEENERLRAAGCGLRLKRRRL